MSGFLNYHHLRYFWTVAREGGIRKAAEKLHVSQPSISAQIRELEHALGEKLFRRQGRVNVLTESGQMTLRYAEEIFTLGQELMSAIHRRPTARAIRLHVGVADALPKLVTHEILKPVFEMAPAVHVVCREGKIDDLLGQLAAHRLDVVLADEPASSSHAIRSYNHKLGESKITLCASGTLAGRLKKDFPRSLHGAPALLPAETTALRRALERWFEENAIQPAVIAEFEDAALSKVVAADGRGFVALPSVVRAEAIQRYQLKAIGTAAGCSEAFYAITAERRITHPALDLITRSARRQLFG